MPVPNGGVKNDQIMTSRDLGVQRHLKIRIY